MPIKPTINVRVVCSKPKVPFYPDRAIIEFEAGGRAILGFAAADARFEPIGSTPGWFLATLTPTRATPAKIRAWLTRKVQAEYPGVWGLITVEVES